jgi:hypothetical protein
VSQSTKGRLIASQRRVRVEGVWVQRPAARAREGSVGLVRVMFVVVVLVVVAGAVLEGVGVGEALRAAVELRVVRFVGEVSPAALGLRVGGGKSLGWLRVATMMAGVVESGE